MTVEEYWKWIHENVQISNLSWSDTCHTILD
jgi:hypothetical protein